MQIILIIFNTIFASAEIVIHRTDVLFKNMKQLKQSILPLFMEKVMYNRIIYKKNFPFIRNGHNR